jgi:hypothetical protein
MTRYEKQTAPKSKHSYKEYHKLAPGHPQYTTHCIKKVAGTEIEWVLVLAGIPIPGSDREEEKEAHQIAMLLV